MGKLTFWAINGLLILLTAGGWLIVLALVWFIKKLFR